MEQTTAHWHFKILTNRRLHLTCLGVCFVLAGLYAQPSNLGDPPVINHTKKNIRSGTQTWDITEDARGYTYFANNAGLLTFDGYNWELYPLPNETIVRSVAVDHHGRIYVGGQGEFGYFAPDEQGKLRFRSLLPALKAADAPIEDVWDILVTGHGVFFRTDRQVFRFHSGQVQPMFDHGRPLNFIGRWGAHIVVQDVDNQLYYFDNTGFAPRRQNPVFDKGRISAVLNYTKDTTLITTINNGIFYESKTGFEPWTTADDDFLRKNIIYCAARMPDGRLLIGTSFNGMVILDHQRRIEQHLNKKHGLQNNTVLSIAGTYYGDIWLGLDNGIDMVDLNAPFRTYFPDGELEGTGYAAIVHQDRLYFGANTGLYTLPWKKYYLPEEKNRAQLVSGARGQVWSLSQIGDQLLVGHHNGAFQVEGLNCRKISDLMGVWKFIPLSDQLALAGYYQGLAVFEKQGQLWRQQRLLKGFSESCRIIHLDAGQNLWIAHPYRGVFLIRRDDIFKPEVRPLVYSRSNELRTELQNAIYAVDGNILLSDKQHFYRFNPQTMKSERFAALDNALSPGSAVKFMLEDALKNIWYGTGDETYLLVPEQRLKPIYSKYLISEITGLLPGGFESVYTIDKHNVIFPTEKGFLLFDPARYIEDTAGVQLFLSKAVLHAQKDSLLYSAHLGNTGNELSFSFGHRHNNLSFYFSVKASGKKDLITYSHLLKGSDTEWSKWSGNPEVDLSKLAPGAYTLLVKARNQTGAESQPFTIHIRIAYPWYTPLAYVLFFTALFVTGYFFFKRQQRKHEREKSHLLEINKKREEEHLLKAADSQEKITRLQNEMLLAELNLKNQELTSFTYHLVNKNDLIAEINDVVHRLEHKFHDQPEINKELKQILKLTEQNADVDAHWDEFIKSFDQVHANFYKRLTEEFKDLSPNDYKMCTYLRMNLSSKEIASLMNISIRSVETNRYRLRKKLGLSGDVNLNQFLMNY